MDAAPAPDAYLVYVWIRDIHPLLWRRVLVRADSTLADLHWGPRFRPSRFPLSVSKPEGILALTGRR
jgi:hypothetical protein